MGETKLSRDIEGAQLDLILDEINEHLRVTETDVLGMEGGTSNRLR